LATALRNTPDIGFKSIFHLAYFTMEIIMNTNPASDVTTDSHALPAQDKWSIARSVVLVLVCSISAASLSVHWLTPIA
jgi:hypothetical protein